MWWLWLIIGLFVGIGIVVFAIWLMFRDIGKELSDTVEGVLHSDPENESQIQ